MKLQQLKEGTFFTTLPKQLVLAKEWKKGDKLKATIDAKGDIVLRKAE